MLAYKLFINGFKANFSGYNKGLITINDISYEWDNNEGPTPLPDPLIIDFLNYEIGIDDEEGNPVYPLPYDFGPYVTATGDGSVPGAQIRAQNDEFEGKTYDRGLRLYGTGRTFTLHVPEGYNYIECVAESTSTRRMSFNGIEVATFEKTAAGIAQKSNKISLTPYGSDIAVGMSGSITLLEIRLYKEGPEPDPVSISVTAFDYEAEAGSLVRDAIHEVTLVYTDGTSRVLDEDEYSTDWAVIDVGQNIIEVSYNENPGISTNIVIEGYQPQPVEPFILNADDYSVGTITGNVGPFTFPQSQEIRNRARTYTGPDGTRSWSRSFKNLAATVDTTGYNKLIFYVSNGSGSYTSEFTISNADETWSDIGHTDVSGSRAVIKVEFTLPESGIYSIRTTLGTVDTHEIQLIKE